CRYRFQRQPNEHCSLPDPRSVLPTRRRSCRGRTEGGPYARSGFPWSESPGCARARFPHPREWPDRVGAYGLLRVIPENLVDLSLEKGWHSDGRRKPDRHTRCSRGPESTSYDDTVSFCRRSAIPFL